MIINKHKLEIAMGNACLTYDELAKNAGVTRISIGKYLSGKRNPKPITVGKIAKALNVTVQEIIEMDAATSGETK